MLDGNEYGPRYAEIGNWVGKAFYSPRISINDVLSRPEFSNPGVYCLKSKPNSTSFIERIYIGEAEAIKNRIKEHLGDPNRDFEELVFFISKDDLLTKTQVKYLESRLITIAKEAKTAEIENTQSPSIPFLHEADISDMEYFLEQMKLIFPIMGFNFLKPAIIKTDSKEKIEKSPSSHFVLYKIKSGSLDAKMYENELGFIVVKGSKANKSLTPSITETYRKLQQNLIDKSILVDKGEYYEFSEDAIFNSPSAASNIVLGRQSAGTIEWITDKGKTYKEVNNY